VRLVKVLWRSRWTAGTVESGGRAASGCDTIYGPRWRWRAARRR